MKKLSSILLLVCFTVYTHAQEKVLLRLNPQQGETKTYEMIMKSDIEGSESMIMDMNMGMTMAATEVTAESITYQAKYTKIRTDINAGMMTISYDSEKAAESQMEEMMASQIKPLLESTLSIVMDKKANIISMDFPNVPDAAFDMGSIQGMSVSFPEHEVAIGESWSSEIELAQLGAKFIMANTLTEKTADGYPIAISGKYTDADGNSIGTATGYYILDPKTFFTKSSNVTSEMEFQGSKIKSTVELREVNK
ncbi:hypothetical protein [Sphingobacterium pedocola]|uniref:DUF4412 domain-containing protein n=1 Tax=Sphingobacterium pedocola TaxID=2082722 RepID=A0ABR9T878_9SPHI|nr:hypothetical protein [Sphingobacterium pedocola]MBE8721535.1 hypothetical protein [Sphingobacterium pedocola]